MKTPPPTLTPPAGRRIRSGATLAALSGVLLLFQACSTPPVADTARVPYAVQGGSPLLAPGYLLDVRVMVSGVNEINEKSLRIQTDGSVNLPFLGAVNAAEMTLDGFQSWLTAQFNARYFINPVVSVNISAADNASAFPWGFVTVLGRVKDPGRVRIPPTQDLTVMQAIQEAGGFIKYARERGIEITRLDKDGASVRMIFDVRQLARSSGETDIPLKHGDIVFVPEVIF